MKIFLDNCDLIILNDGRPIKCYVISLKMSCIDLTFESAALSRVGDWNVIRKARGSDHFPIIINIGSSLVIEAEDRLKRFNFSHAEWETLKETTVEGLG